MLTSTPVMAALSVLVVLVISVVAIWLLLRWRESSRNDIGSAQSYLKDFEEMRLGGDITNDEYRNIKSLLGTKTTETVDEPK